MAACVHHQRLGCQQRLHLFEQQGPLLAMRDKSCCWRVQKERCAFHFRRQRRNARVVRGVFSPRQRSARRLRPELSYRDSSHCQLMSGSPRGWEGRRIELGERMLRLVQTPDKKQPSDLEMSRMRRIQAVTVLFERFACCVKHFRGPAQVA
jgi:hypothetical protein